MNRSVAVFALISALFLVFIGISQPSMAQGKKSPPTFAEIDSNGDGMIDPQEFAAHQDERMASNSAGRGGQGNKGQGKPAAGQSGQGKADAREAMFSQLDQDGDGCLVIDEFVDR